MIYLLDLFWYEFYEIIIFSTSNNKQASIY